MSGFLIAIAPLDGTYLDPGIPREVFSLFFYGSFLFLAVPVGSFLVGRLLDKATAETSYKVRPIKRKEIDTLLPLYNELIGGPRVSNNNAKEMLDVNPETIMILEKTSVSGLKTKLEAVGFCTIWPLTRDAANLVSNEELNGLQMNARHICNPKQKPYALYVGSIGAKGSKAKAHILGYLISLIDRNAKNGAGFAYTKPSTKDGLRLAKQYDFTPVKNDASADELNRVYKLKLPR